MEDELARNQSITEGSNSGNTSSASRPVMSHGLTPIPTLVLAPIFTPALIPVSFDKLFK